jgi:hypothetical protein
MVILNPIMLLSIGKDVVVCLSRRLTIGYSITLQLLGILVCTWWNVISWNFFWLLSSMIL